MTQDLRTLFNIDQIEREYPVIEITKNKSRLNHADSTDRPMILRYELRALFAETGRDVNDYIGKNLGELNGKSPYDLAFRSSDGLEKAIETMKRVYDLN